jgi:N,N'-diacetyllegionaminate synthase
MDFDSASFSFLPADPSVSIAEIGVNHNGDMVLAKKLIDEAIKCGADIVKFQAFVAEEEISKFADKADYQKETTGSGGGQLEMAKALELNHKQLTEIRDYCREKGAPFLCTAFDYTSLDFLVNELQVKAIKIASSEVTNHPFLRAIARSGVGIILSTGASSMQEVLEAVDVIRQEGDNEMVVLHCVSNYPADMSQLNLRCIQTMAAQLNVPVGYSDHSMGVEAPIVASALGAVLVEKHFTLDRNMEGPDHRASVEPAELMAMVKGMSASRAVLGDGVKKVVACELDNRSLIRKSLVAMNDLPKGHVITSSDLAAKRPLGGVEPFDLERIIGKRLLRAIEEDAPVRWEDLADE